MQHQFAHVVDRENGMIVFGNIEIVKLTYNPLRKTDIFYWYSHEEMMKFLDMEVWQECPLYLRVDVDNMMKNDFFFQEAHRVAQLRIITRVIEEIAKHPDIGDMVRKTSANKLYELGQGYINDIMKSIPAYFSPTDLYVSIEQVLIQKFLSHFTSLEVV